MLYIMQRCNLLTDCPDESDEKDCDILVLEEDYNGAKFPRSRDNKALPIYVRWCYRHIYVLTTHYSLLTTH